MTAGARDLLVLLSLAAAVALAVRAAWPTPPLGPAVPSVACAIPVEREGRGVACLEAAEAARLGVAAGDRIGADGARGRMAPSRLATLGASVEINRASSAELESLPGIGPMLAERIIARRPFESIAAVAEVPGVGPKRLSAIASRLRLGAP